MVIWNSSLNFIQLFWENVSKPGTLILFTFINRRASLVDN